MVLPKRALTIGAIAVGLGVVYSMGVEPPNGTGATSPDQTSGTAACRVAVTADVLNVREAPNTGAAIVGKFNQGAETVADRVVENGFRKLGEARWASNEFLAPLPGHDCG